MTKPRTPPPPTEPEPTVNGNHEIALWAGLAAFFGSVLAIGVWDVLGIEGWAEFLLSIIVAVFTAGAVYSKERLAFAKKQD